MHCYQKQSAREHRQVLLGLGLRDLVQVQEDQPSVVQQEVGQVAVPVHGHRGAARVGHGGGEPGRHVLGLGGERGQRPAQGVQRLVLHPGHQLGRTEPGQPHRQPTGMQGRQLARHQRGQALRRHLADPGLDSGAGDALFCAHPPLRMHRQGPGHPEPPVRRRPQGELTAVRGNHEVRRTDLDDPGGVGEHGTAAGQVAEQLGTGPEVGGCPRQGGEPGVVGEHAGHPVLGRQRHAVADR